MTTSDKIDRIVTNRILGLPIFAAVMWLVYYISVTTLGTMGTDWANDTFGGAIMEAAGSFLGSLGASDLITGLVVDGILGGLVAVFGFLPQMALLFLLLSILEDIGYMVRIAFVMDRIFRHFGLSGKSFIPLLISSGCGIPGIMASRTIENDKRPASYDHDGHLCSLRREATGHRSYGRHYDRLGNGDYSSLESSLRLMYFIGVGAVLVSAIMLRRRNPSPASRLPSLWSFRPTIFPSAKTVLMHTWERLWGFIKKAGTILFLACVVMWVLSTFGWKTVPSAL